MALLSQKIKICLLSFHLRSKKIFFFVNCKNELFQFLSFNSREWEEQIIILVEKSKWRILSCGLHCPVGVGVDSCKNAVLLLQHSSTRISVGLTNAAAPVDAVIGQRIVSVLNGAVIHIISVIEAVVIVEEIAAIGPAFPDWNQIENRQN